MVKLARHLKRDQKAIILANNLGGQIAQMFINSQLNRFIPGEVRIFHDLSEAIAWLETFLEDNEDEACE